jgi:branched-chain amino acid transport system substrate-binding protein
VVNGFYRDTARLVAALRAAAYTGPIVLDDGSYTDAFIAAAGPAADQTYILCGCAPADIDPRFADRYAAKFGAPPPIYAAEAYDLTRALIATLSAGARDRIGVADRLSVMSHSGVTKRYSWMPTGELESAPVYVVTPRSVDGELRFVGDGIVTVTDP